MLVVGPGRVGGSLARSLRSAGLEVELADRETPPRRAETLLLCVPDDAIAGTAAAWAVASATSAEGVDGRVPVALHTAGAQGSSVLAPLREAGYRTGVLHPLVALPEARGDAFRGVAFGVSGDPEAVARAERLVGALGGRTLRVEPGGHALYHAAAVFASNFLVACLGVAGAELARATGGEAGPADLLPLAHSALNAVEDRGPALGATGPLVRGDAGTLRRHLEALGPERAELYRLLARELLALVGDRVAPERVAELSAALDPDRRGRDP